MYPAVIPGRHNAGTYNSIFLFQTAPLVSRPQLGHTNIKRPWLLRLASWHSVPPSSSLSAVCLTTHSSYLQLTFTAMALTLTAILLPTWITFTSGPAHSSYGIHSYCTNSACSPFPIRTDCTAGHRSFCVQWRTAAFALNLTFLTELATLVTFALVLLGGKQMRDQGTRVLSVMLMLCAAGQVLTVALVARLFEVDDRFFEGWRLGGAWALTVASAALQCGAIVGLVAAKWYLPEEGGYELIPNRPMDA